MRKLLLGLSLSFLASASYAADAVVDEVVVVDAAYDWSGVYVGAQVGYAWGKSEVVFEPNGVYNQPDPDGWLGGVYVGFNHQLSNKLVLGIEGDFAFASVTGQNINIWDGIPFPLDVIESDMNWSGAVRGRLGYAFDRFLPYLSAGLAFADYDHTVLFEGVSIGDFGETYIGWTIGLGLDFALTDHLLLRSEYRYSDFGSESFAGSVNDHDVDLSTNDVRFGIAYKF